MEETVRAGSGGSPPPSSIPNTLTPVDHRGPRGYSLTPATPADAFTALIEAAVTSGIKKALDIDADTNRRLLSIEKAAVYLDLSERELYNMVASQDLPVVKRGRRVLFDVRDLNAWIERNKTGYAYTTKAA